MDFRFIGNPWNASSYSHPLYQQPFRGVPVGQFPVQVQPKPTPPRQPKKPRVVSIPVRSVESDRSRSESAVKIQKVFRGFLVRINMKKIKAIWKEVNDIQRRISKEETVDLIRNDSKERLKVNEMLMSLLLTLDSVRGVDSGVRDSRKFAIKNVIALQELVDAIVSGDQPNNSDAVVQSKTEAIDEDADVCNRDPELPNHEELTTEITESTPNNSDAVVQSKTEAIDEDADVCNPDPELPNHEELTTEITESTPNSSESNVNPQNQEIIDPHQEYTESTGTESQTDSSTNPENSDEAAPAAAHSPVSALEENPKEDRGEYESKIGKDLLQRMMIDNEKMMSLMAELCERNEKQTRLLSALTQRVEQLEKAFLLDKLRRKTRRSAATAGCVDCVEKSPNVKKCGKR